MEHPSSKDTRDVQTSFLLPYSNENKMRRDLCTIMKRSQAQLLDAFIYL